MALTQISTDGIKNGTITGSDLATNVDLVDNQKLRFGTGNDLQVYHDGSNSHVTSGTGQFFLSSSNSNIWLRGNEGGMLTADGTEYLIRATSNGSVKLFHDNSKKIETSSTGATVTGTLIADGLTVGDAERIKLGNDGDLELYHTGTETFIKNSTGTLNINNDGVTQIKNYADNEFIAKFTSGGSVELYHANSKKLETTSYGIDVTGSVHSNGDLLLNDDNQKILIGGGNDLQIYHDGSNSLIVDAGTGGLILGVAGTGTSGFYKGTGQEPLATFEPDGPVSLYHNNSKKFETHSAGVKVSDGNLYLDRDNAKVVLGASDDLEIYHDGSNSIINDNGTGQLQLQVGGSTKFNTQSGGVQFYGSIFADDSNKIELGNDQDLQIFHDGNDSFIKDVGVGGLVLCAHQFLVRNAAANEIQIQAVENGAVELYYDNSKKLETQNDGVTFLEHAFFGDNDRAKFGASNDLQVYHHGHSTIQNSNSTAALLISSFETHIVNAALTENIARFKQNGACELFFDNSKQFETTSSGTTTFGTHHSTSDIALKTNIEPITNTLEKIKQITGYKYKFIKSNENSIGVVAQEVEKVFPELVDGTEGNKTLQYNGLIGVLIEAVKELSAEVAALKAS